MIGVEPEEIQRKTKFKMRKTASDRNIRKTNKTNYTRQKAHVNKADSCAVLLSKLGLQLLHFHAVFKTWSAFQELKSIVSFRERR